MSILVICALTVAGINSQNLEFEFTKAEADKFMVQQGKGKNYTKQDLDHEVCSDIDNAIVFEEDQIYGI